MLGSPWIRAGVQCCEPAALVAGHGAPPPRHHLLPAAGRAAHQQAARGRTHRLGLPHGVLKARLHAPHVLSDIPVKCICGGSGRPGQTGSQAERGLPGLQHSNGNPGLTLGESTLSCLQVISFLLCRILLMPGLILLYSLEQGLGWAGTAYRFWTAAVFSAVVCLQSPHAVPAGHRRLLQPELLLVLPDDPGRGSDAQQTPRPHQTGRLKAHPEYGCAKYILVASSITCE